MKLYLLLTWSFLVFALSACGEATVIEEPRAPITVLAPAIEGFAATPETLIEDQSSELTWTLGGGEVMTLVLTNSVNDERREVKGQTSVSVFPTETTTYTLRATNEGGEASEDVTLEVGSAAITPPSSDPNAAILVANDDRPGDAEGEEGPDIDIDVLLNDSYPADGYSFPEITISAQPEAGQGQVIVDGTDVLYMSESFVGSTTFEYTLSITDEATGDVLSDSATVNLTVR